MSYRGTSVAPYGRLHQGSYDLALLDAGRLNSGLLMRADAAADEAIALSVQRAIDASHAVRDKTGRAQDHATVYISFF